MLFGLSMDYEVFLVSRMREAWDATRDNQRSGRDRPGAHGADRDGGGDHHGRGVLGLPLGSISALQQFGFGLALAILIDATIIRMLLVPAFMQLAGAWNWHLPAWVARVLRVEPSDRRAPAPRAE